MNGVRHFLFSPLFACDTWSFTFVADVGLVASFPSLRRTFSLLRLHKHESVDSSYQTNINACDAFLLTQLIIGRDS